MVDDEFGDYTTVCIHWELQESNEGSPIQNMFRLQNQLGFPYTTQLKENWFRSEPSTIDWTLTFEYVLFWMNSYVFKCMYL